MDKKTYEYMGNRVEKYRELEAEKETFKKLIEKLAKVGEDKILEVYIDAKKFIVTPRMIKAVKDTLKSEYNFAILENEKEMEEI